jgi:uncharacterized membrane protein YcaP (DUF421 family)
MYTIKENEMRCIMTEILYIAVLSAGSLFSIFILTKIIGYRQMSQMSMFDYINGITIGSIAAEMATSLDQSFVQPLTAMIIYALFTLILSVFTSKSIKVRRIVEGRPIVLLNNGELYTDNLKKAKIDFDVSKLQTAVLEGNGKISFLPKASDRPLTPADMNLSPAQDYMVANVIIDGKIMQDNLKHTGNDEKWLHSQIKAQGADSVRDVLLATCDMDNKVTVFLKKSTKQPVDVLI